MNTFKRILSLILSFVLFAVWMPTNALAEALYLAHAKGAFRLIASAAAEEADYTYTLLGDGTAAITGYTGSETILEIPSALDGYAVTAIDSGAFLGNSALTGVTLPEGLTAISESAFEGCTSLKDISLPDGLTTIGRYAFMDCTALTEVHIPDSVTHLLHRAFADCTSLSSVNYPRSWETTYFGYAEGEVFMGCTSLTSISIPEGVTTIAPDAFSRSSLASVSLPSTLTTIDSYAFLGCASLTEINFPAGLDAIAEGAFEGCTSLADISLPDGLTTIGRYAFMDCTSLTEVHIPDSVTHLLHRAFAGCSSLSSVNYPRSWETTYFGYAEGEVFMGCTSLTSISIPEGVTTVAPDAFSRSSLSSVSLPSTLTTIDSYAFLGCASLTEINFPAGLDAIAEGAFEGCTSLADISLPDGLTTIGRYAFMDCTSLTEVHIPDSVTHLLHRAFAGCSSLSSVNYPRSWETTYFGYAEGEVFMGCTALASISIPEGVTAIVPDAFSRSSLSSVSLPSSVVSIGDYAFFECSDLVRLHIPRSVTSISSNAFEGCDSLTIYCSANSPALITAIDLGLDFVITESIDAPAASIFRSRTFFADLGSASSNGCVAVTLSYSLTERAAGMLSDKALVLNIPETASLLESTMYLDGALVQDYTLEDAQLTVPVSASQGTLRFYLELVGQAALTGYAYLRYTADGVSGFEVIGHIDDETELLTLNTASMVSSGTLSVRGLAPAGAAVSLTIDGEAAGSAVASKAGAYSAELTLPDAQDHAVYLIGASAVGVSGKLYEASARVTYRYDPPTMTSFLLYYDSHGDAVIDLLDPVDSQSTIYFNPDYEMTFTIGFTHPEEISALYVTTTRNNTKHMLEATYDADRDLFIATGYFDENNHSYIPSNLCVEYSLRRDPVLVKTDVDLSQYAIEEMQLIDCEESENQFSATVDFSALASGSEDARASYTITTTPYSSKDTLNDVLSAHGMLTTNFRYTMPAENGDTYVVYSPRSSSTHMVVLIVDTGKEIIEVVVQAVGELNFPELSEVLSGPLALVGLGFDLYGTYGDCDDAVNQIYMNSSIKDKAQAVSEVKDLYGNYRSFLIVAALFGVVGGAAAPFAGAGILFGALMGCIGALGGAFVDLKLFNIMGEKHNARFAIDPSGYVYEAVLSNRLPGVTASAYWVEYDPDDEAFWDRLPAEDDGTLWDASEWDQQNPQFTDAEGRYRWDVPEGWWQVRLSLDGYEDTVSEWLCVAPPQTDVNLPMVCYEAPVFTSIVPHSDHIAIESSRYLQPETLSSLRLSSGDGTPIPFTPEYSEKETDAQGRVFVRSFVLRLADGAALGVRESFTLSVPEGQVLSYCGTPMQPDAHSLVYTGERAILADSSLMLSAGSSASFSAVIENYAPGDVLLAESSAPNLLRVAGVSDPDESGRVVITVEGVFTGQAELRLQLDGHDATTAVACTIVDGKCATSNGYTTTLGEPSAENGVISMAYSVSASGSQAQQILVIAAAYDAGSMVGSCVDTAFIGNGQTHEGTLSYGAEHPGARVKIMLCSPASLAPLSDAFDTVVP